ncbi:GNAT family N-acetyltransferase [Phenylobacterium sp.]|uniref:GNAT family N-acetyltransferase n=1 Tax=Phenylobacterium sp. TaxID=1871053 RepID=UPI00286E9A2D|nr:GNAT family N-acetyltransferase [Phenylobacterium sp.]
MSVMVLETERLFLRHLTPDDDGFILELLNEPGFLENIGDRQVRDLEGARRYVADGPAVSYARHGFGLWWVGLKASAEPVGICGLIKREMLDHPDIGYAFLARFSGQGFASEAGAAVLAYGRSVLGLGRIVAITKPDNDGSIRVLEKIGLTFDGMVNLPDHGGESCYFVSDA